MTLTRPRRDALAIALVVLCIYLLTASGHLYSPDEETMVQVASGILTRGAVDIPRDRPLPVIALHPGADGLWYSHFGILPSLLALPFLVVGRVVGGDTATGAFLARLLVSLINAPITALTAELLALFVRRLGYGRAAAWIAALVFACATPAWVYARTFFSEPLTALLLLVAVERAFMFRTSGQRVHAFQSGLACGLILATRVAGAVALPWIALYLVWSINARPTTSDRQSITSTITHQIARIVPWLVGLIPGLVLFVGYNLARGAAPWSTGYGSESWVFTTPLRVSIPGMFWQPERGLLWYAPPVLLSCVGIWWFARRQRALTLLIVVISVSYTLLHAGRTAWEGGAAWGPRYILALVPLWLLFAAPVLGTPRKTEHEQRTSRQNARVFVVRPLFLASLVVITAGLFVTLLGVLVNFNTYYNDAALRARATLFGAQTPLAAHWLLLRERLAATNAADRCALGNGFYPPEGKAGDQLPRRIGATGALDCVTSGLSEISLLLDDRRPPNAPVGELALTANNVAVAGIEAGQQRWYTLVVPPGRTTLELRSTTWNPQAIAFSERNDELGVALMAFTGREVGGAALPLSDATIEPLPTDPVKRWAWYYQPTNHHLLDMWWWYLPRSEIGTKGTWIMGTLLVALALGALGSAVVLLRENDFIGHTKGKRGEAQHPVAR